MAGKKGRKRPKSEPKRPKKKIPSEKVNETVALNVEEKKPKLDDELEKRDEQSPGKQEPNFETIDSTTIDSVEEVTGDLQAEESKYVPPFTRKTKRTLKRNGTPLSPVARPKRSWRGVQQNLNDAQPAVCPLDSDKKRSDVVRNEGRPATLKDKEEEEIDVVGIEGQILCSQDVEDSSSLYSTSQTIEEIVAEKRGGVVSTLPPAIVQNEPLAIVMHVLDEVVDYVCKMVQCNSGKTAMESEKNNKESGEEEVVLAKALDNMSRKNIVNRSEMEHPVATKQSLDTCMDATSETNCSDKTAANEEVATESITEYSAYDGSALMAKTRAVDNSVDETTLDIKRSEDPSWECVMGGIDHAQLVLQSFNNVENLRNPHEVDNDQWNENACDFNNVYKEEDKPQNPKTENAAAVSPTVKLVVTITEEDGSTDPSSTLTMSSMDAELRSSGPLDDQRVDKKNCDQKSGDSSSSETVTFAAEDTENVSEKKVVTLELEQMPGSHLCENIVKDLCQLKKQQVVGEETHLERDDFSELKAVGMDSKENMESVVSEVPSSNVGNDDFNDFNNPTKHQGVDQMVPTNYEHTTVLSQENPDAVEMAPKVRSDQESSALSGEDKAMHMQSSVQASPITYTETMHDTTEPECQKAVEEEKHSALSSSQSAQECSLFGTVGDILEFDCLMDCTDSQLVCLDSSVDQPATNQHTETREVNKNEAAVTSTSQAGQCTVEVPSDNGMIKGLISELSALNKFLMGVWRGLEYQRKQKQRGLRLSKGKKLK